jgi:flagellar basal-body rod modification protein FlgD
MSDVSSVQSVLSSLNSSSTSSTSETTDETEALLEDFMTIFLAQLQYQDPLNPMEGTDMTAQLAQISTLEQQYSTNETLESISEQIGELGGNDLLGYLGKEVWLEGGVINIQDGNTPKGEYIIEDYADVEITIYDTDGNEIKQLSLGYLEAGEYDLEWDGTDSSGEQVEDGIYVYDVVATGQDGSSVSTWTSGTGIVTGITYQDEEPYLMIGDDGILSPDSVIRVCETTSS